MLVKPSDVLSAFPVRKTRLQKNEFCDDVLSYAASYGYAGRIEQGSLGSQNIVVGDPDHAKYLITAHYDTCARMLLPNLITPCSFFLFICYQLVITLLIMIVAILSGVSVGLLVQNEEAGKLVGVALVWLLLILMVLGPANPNNANDNSSGVITLLEIMRSMPQNQRHKVCFVLFDLEEAGLIGSASYRKKHKKASDRQLVLNLDCVGDGDHILFFPTKMVKKEKAARTLLYKACGYFGNKSIFLREKGFSIYPSDQANFPYGVGIAAFHKGKLGLYLSKIHTTKDTTLDETNVNILRAALISMISCDAV